MCQKFVTNYDVLFIDDIVGFDAADLDRDMIAERLKKDDVRI